MRLREAARRHAAPVAGFLVMVLVFGGFAVSMRPVGAGVGPGVAALPVDAIPLPLADADQDTYGDDVDLWEGNAVARLHFELGALGDEGIILVGTQDDQYRFGAGRELAWRHVVDHDPLGRRPGSDAWIEDALRTGVWVHAASWERGAPDSAGATLDVRDDQETVEITVEWWDTRPDPDRLRVRQAITVGADGIVNADGGDGADGVELADGLRVKATLGPVLDQGTRQAIAERWAPVLRFDRAEAFYPTGGDVLEEFHGFARGAPELRTWAGAFDNGRDDYRLLLADFNGDGLIDHQDAAVMTDVLRAGGRARDTVYAHVTTFGDRVVVQYWFLYVYNFVVDELGNDLPPLAHAGDREFVQLVFPDLDAALEGRPSDVVYSQHYRGVRIPAPEEGEPPFRSYATNPAVFIARGSHASYPVAGTDAAIRTVFAGYGDDFDGRGEVWRPGEYTLELLDDQTWHAGYLWGPATRFSRDLGTAARPLLLHDFTYPFTDPLHWMDGILEVEAEDLDRLYGAEDR